LIGVVILNDDCVKTPFMVSFGGVYPEQSRRAQDKLLTTNGVVSLEIEYLSVRPETAPSKGSERVFTQSDKMKDLA
jgi:hypothetical protein